MQLKQFFGFVSPDPTESLLLHASSSGQLCLLCARRLYLGSRARMKSAPATNGSGAYIANRDCPRCELCLASRGLLHAQAPNAPPPFVVEYIDRDRFKVSICNLERESYAQGHGILIHTFN